MNPHTPRINKFEVTNKKSGALFGGDHIVRSSKVDSSTIGIPIGALTKAFTVP